MVMTPVFSRRLGATLIMTRQLSSGSRPFRVLGLQQVAIGGLSKGPLSRLWEGLLGVPKVGSYVSEKENVDGAPPPASEPAARRTPCARSSRCALSARASNLVRLSLRPPQRTSCCSGAGRWRWSST